MFLTLVALTTIRESATCWITQSLQNKSDDEDFRDNCPWECNNGQLGNLSDLTQEDVNSQDVFCFGEGDDEVIPLDYYYQLSSSRLQLSALTANTIIRIATERNEIGLCSEGDGYDSCSGHFPELEFNHNCKVAVINPNGNKLFLQSLRTQSSSADVTFVSGDSSQPQPGTPLAEIFAYKMNLWDSLIQQNERGEIKLQSYNYIAKGVIPVRFATGQLPFVQEKYSYCYNGVCRPTYQSNRKSFTLTLEKDATVTYGKGQVTVKYDDLESDSMVLDVTGDEYLWFSFEFSKKLKITADSSLQSGDHVVGGQLWAPYGGNHFEMSGTWPTVSGSFLQSGDATTDGGFQTMYPISYFVLRSEIPVTLSGANLPLTAAVSNLILEDEEVSMQGLFGWTSRSSYVNLSSSKTVFHIKSDIPLYSDPPEVEVNGGSLTIIQRVCSEKSTLPGPNIDVLCECVSVKDMSRPERASGSILVENGKVETAHGQVGIENSYDTLDAYVRNHTHEWCEFESEADIVAQLWDDWKYVAQMLKSEGHNLVEAIKKDVFPRFATVSNISCLGKATIEVYRREIPVYSFFSSDFDPIVCVNQGEKLNVQDWSVTWNPGVFYYDRRDFTKWIPQVKEYGVTGVIEKRTQDGYDCIGYKLTKPPNSALVVVVYMANETLIDSLSFFSEMFTVITPSTIDQKVVLQNPSAKNVLLVCFDDIPSGKKINLWDMRVDSNLFVVGLPMSAVYDGTVFKAIQDGVKNEDIMAAFQPLLDEYKGFLPRVSLNIHNHDSIVMIGCNYVGASINCNIFAALACDFGEIQLSTKYVYTDTSTYDSLKSKNIDNLVLIPVSVSPPDYLSISSIEFEPGKWRLIGKGLYNSDEKDPIVKYEIETSRVGQLHIVSNTNKIEFTIPKDTTLTSAKGVSVIMGLNTDNMYTTLPEYPLLSDDESEHKSLLKSVTGHLRRLVHQLSTKATEKSATFVGEWSKVTEVQGSFSVDAGSEPIAVTDVPTTVVASLQVKSSEKSQVNLPAGVEPIDLTIPLLSIAGAQSLSYGNGVKSVTFDNLTFLGGRIGSVIESSITLSINEENKEISAKHVKCFDYSSVDVKALKLSDSLEMGVGSTFQAPEKYDQNKLAVSLHYTIYSLANRQTPTFTKLQNVPKELKFIYDNDEMSFDMNAYAKQPLTLLTLQDEATCNEWLKVGKFVAENPNFQDANVISAKCEGKELKLTLNKVPEPTPMPTIPEESPEGDPVNIGAIVGGVIGGIAVVALVAVAIFLVLRRKTLFKHNTSSSGDFSNETASTTE